MSMDDSERSPSDRNERETRLQAVAERMRGRFQTIEEITQAFLREAILHGLYRPGERLQQDRIAALLGVSRMPVRSSLRLLEAEGLISIVPYKGAIVSVLTPEEIAEIYDLRALVETYLIERAGTRLTPEIIQEFEDLVGRMEQPGLSPAERADRRIVFYDRLYALAEAPWAFKLAQQLRVAVRRYVLLERVDEGRPSHAELVRRLKANDIAGARQWHAEHLARVSRELQEMIATERAPAS